MILVDAFLHAKTDEERADLYRFYLRSIPFVNNWDLVDGSAPPIVGGYLWDKDRAPLHLWARSKSLWERRIAVVATHYFIKRDDFTDILRLARFLRSDREDLIQKAVGWMLREVGKRDARILEGFLKGNYLEMGRTSLRYAIERFPQGTRKRYLEGRA